MKAIKVEIRRNRDLKMTCEAVNPEVISELFHFTEEERRRQALYNKIQAELEEQIWEGLLAGHTKDLDGNIITRETHEVGFDIARYENRLYAANAWVRPIKSEYEK